MRRLNFGLLLAGIGLCGVTACASSGASAGTSAAPAATPRTRTQSMGNSDIGRIAITTVTEADVVTVPFDADAVFRILPSVLDSLGVAVNTLDPAKKVIGNNGFKIRNRLGKTPLSMIVDCGNTQIGPNADSYDVYMSVMTTVGSGGAGSATIATLVEAQARPATYNQAYSPCSSKSSLEQKIADLVTKRLRK